MELGRVLSHRLTMRLFAVAVIATATACWSNSALADPLDSPVVGPKLICFKYSSFALEDGESITDFSGGAEAMVVRVEGPAGRYQIAESEIFSSPKRMNALVFRREHTRVYRLRQPELRYAITGRTSYSTGSDELVIWLSGEALDGTRSDSSVYERLDVRDPSSLPCQSRFTYGWDMVLGSD